jgi:hypothetical protein
MRISKDKTVCSECWFKAHPEDRVKRRRIQRLKEKRIVTDLLNFISDNPEVTPTRVVMNRTIRIGSSYRPDFFMDFGDKGIFVCIDEHQHQTYNQPKEIKREQDLAEHSEMKQVVFLRFNPDKYSDANGMTVRSVFIEREETVETTRLYQKRMSALTTRMLHHVKTDTTESFIREYLFYDECDLENVVFSEYDDDLMGDLFSDDDDYE